MSASIWWTNQANQYKLSHVSAPTISHLLPPTLDFSSEALLYSSGANSSPSPHYVDVPSLWLACLSELSGHITYRDSLTCIYMLQLSAVVVFLSVK